ncbi:hypothetical protein SAMN04488067_10295 [Halorubrum xinjiangense]|uniref:Uncharacterized protein n=1 Tax=Halorubrum xinjiangense TaxID=261291 RepID=A0A1G7ILZ1_9EURY|nr:hypothetical protein [Halorubrum xinjiangense]SDF13578.1 hypothetical protein SAMN04488067_10295 [Halorubrum xinjiangense]
MPDESRFDPTDRSEYELVRAGNVIVPLSPVRKARMCGAIALLGSLAAPIVATLPLAVREAAFSGPPLAAPLGVAAVVLVGALAAGGGGLGLVALQRRLTRGPEPTGDGAWEVLAVEDVLTGIGFVTGGLGVGVGLSLLASGHWGVDALESLRRNGIEPYASLSTPLVTPQLATAVALTAGLVVLAATAVVDGE